MIAILFSIFGICQTESGVHVGNISSLNRIDIYLDPASQKTPEFYVQFQQIITDYGDYANINIHPVPSNINQWSFAASRLIYSISSLNLTTEQNRNILFYLLYTNPTKFFDIKRSISEDDLINEYAEIIEKEYKVNQSQIVQSYHEEAKMNATINEILDQVASLHLTDFPSILFNGINVPFFSFKSFVYYNIKEIQKVVKRKTFRFFRKNKDKRGLRRYSEIYFGYLNAKYVFDLYFDPVSKSATKILNQIDKILKNYSSHCKIVAHVTPTPESKKSFMMTSLINAVKRVNPMAATQFLPWIVNGHQELFQNDDRSTEYEILDKILPSLEANFGLNQTLILNQYVTVENGADSIGAIFNLVYERIPKLPAAKINGYSFSFDEDTDLLELFVEHFPIRENNSDDL